MRQILQDMSAGATFIVDSPAPSLSSTSVLITTTTSLISAGTERMLVDFGRSSYLEKARQKPEKVRAVLEKVKTDGLLPTVEAVRSKLCEPIPLGYCNVGRVAKVGDSVEGFFPGDRVVSNGPHADVVAVPKHLCAKIPASVDDESAAFTVIASIGLQGLRLAQPTLGESFVVTGVGLIGLLTVQMLRAHGCRVLAVDYDAAKLELARQFGAEICNLTAGEDPVNAGDSFSRGRGVDGVIITASTKSNDPVTQAAQMCRKRGRIILVGVTGLELNRADFYEKELSFQVSCSYGPGRYDPNYEEGGLDYPLGFVRWTEQRNFEAVLDLLASGQLDVRPLITDRFAFEDASSAYQKLTSDNSGLGLLLGYSSNADERLSQSITLDGTGGFEKQKPVFGFIGAGNYASRILIPAFRKAGAQLHTLATSGGTSAAVYGRRAGFSHAATNVDLLFKHEVINAIVVVTRHSSHAGFVSKAITADKHVFVEKPLAIDREGLAKIQKAWSEGQKKSQVMVGYNRRFAPHVVKMKELLGSLKEPKSFMMTMNAGYIPKDHWTQEPAIGGGRIVGEACHYIDLMRFLAGSPIVSVQALCMGELPNRDVVEDKASITLGFEDGSFGTIMYLANGAASFPKERVEVFCSGRILQLDNFRRLKGFGWPNFSKMNLFRQNKGQVECARAFLSGLESGKPAIPIDEIFEVAKVTLDAAELLRQQ
jgi:predicted dehydrogenase/threonine dehydrogenase-like Zn-dependent dehydrogenase